MKKAATLLLSIFFLFPSCKNVAGGKEKLPDAVAASTTHLKNTPHTINDNLPSTAHFGIFEDENLAGVISIFKADANLLTQTNQFQIRGMAVLDSQNGNAFWFNAREIAVGFYRKMGYEIIGTPFTIGDIGIHYIMYRLV